MQRLLDEYRKKQFSVAQEVLKYTCPFLIENEKGETEGHGCGLLINIQENYFLISAAHVLEKYIGDIYIPIGGFDAVQLGGEMLVNKEISKNREKDEVDIGIILLCEVTTKELKKWYSFLNETDIEINHVVNHTQQYISSGYPASRVKQKYGTDIIQAKPFYYITMPAKDNVYQKLGYSPTQSIILNYNKKNVFSITQNEKVTGPNPYGISGSGLWYIPINAIIHENEIHRKLIGVMIEWSGKDKVHWLSTRIDLFTEIVSTRYNLGIAKSNLVRINIL